MPRSCSATGIRRRSNDGAECCRHREVATRDTQSHGPQLLASQRPQQEAQHSRTTAVVIAAGAMLKSSRLLCALHKGTQTVRLPTRNFKSELPQDPYYRLFWQVKPDSFIKGVPGSWAVCRMQLVSAGPRMAYVSGPLPFVFLHQTLFRWWAYRCAHTLPHEQACAAAACHSARFLELHIGVWKHGAACRSIQFFGFMCLSACSCSGCTGDILPAPCLPSLLSFFLS